MIVEATNYFAKEGLAETVLERRREGSRIRQRLGLPAGRIFVNTSGQGPDVRWECAAQRAEMGKLTQRFERHVLHLDTTEL